MYNKVADVGIMMIRFSIKYSYNEVVRIPVGEFS